MIAAGDLDPSVHPRIYRIATGWKVFLVAFGLGAAALGLFLGWKCWFDLGDHALALAIFGLLALLLGVYVLVDTSVSKVILYADAIEIRDLLPVRRLARADIRGRMLLESGQAGTVIVFVPADASRKRVKLPMIIQRDEALDRWLESIPDLDRAEREASERAILHDAGDGATPEARRVALASAQKTARVLNALAIASVVAGFAVPHPAVVAVLAALPWAAIAVAARSNGLYSLNDSRNDARAGIGAALILPGLILALRAIDYQLLDWIPVLAAAGAIALLMTALASRADPRLVRTRTVFVALPLLVPYGYGALIAVDTLLDHSSATVYETTVTAKRPHSGRGSHQLEVAAWGPHAGGKVGVSRALFDSVSAGSAVCVYLRSGAIGIPWYYVDHCR